MPYPADLVTTGQVGTSPLKVVVIDDDTTLIHQGCQTLNTMAKAEALNGQVDALILDERLPHTAHVSKADHPLTLVHAIRSACDPTPVIALT